MKTRIFSLVIAFVLFAFFLNTQAQSNKKYKKEKKSKIILKIDKQGIPDNLNPGQNFVLDINIENNSKTSYWNSSSLTYEVEYPFSIYTNYLSEITLAPGESAAFNYTVTVPNTNGKEKFKMVFYNDGKKKKQVVKMINIGYVENNEYYKGNEKIDDDNKNKENKKNDENEKNKNNKKNKDKNKGNNNEEKENENSN